MTNENDCMEWLDEVGQCDLEDGHFPETPHVSVNEVGGAYTKTIWPVGADDPDVKHYIAWGEAYAAAYDRAIAGQAPARAANADGAE